MPYPLSFDLTIDIVEHKEMSFVFLCTLWCYCCDSRSSNTDLVGLVGSLTYAVVCTCRLGPTFLKLSMWNLVAMCKIRIVVIHKLMDPEMYFGNADLGLKFERWICWKTFSWICWFRLCWRYCSTAVNCCIINQWSGIHGYEWSYLGGYLATRFDWRL